MSPRASRVIAALYALDQGEGVTTCLLSQVTGIDPAHVRRALREIEGAGLVSRSDGKARIKLGGRADEGGPKEPAGRAERACPETGMFSSAEPDQNAISSPAKLIGTDLVAKLSKKDFVPADVFRAFGIHIQELAGRRWYSSSAPDQCFRSDVQGRRAAERVLASLVDIHGVELVIGGLQEMFAASGIINPQGLLDTNLTWLFRWLEKQSSASATSSHHERGRAAGQLLEITNDEKFTEIHLAVVRGSLRPEYSPNPTTAAFQAKLLSTLPELLPLGARLRLAERLESGEDTAVLAQDLDRLVQQHGVNGRVI